jgi:hypothetical protein
MDLKDHIFHLPGNGKLAECIQMHSFKPSFNLQYKNCYLVDWYTLGTFSKSILNIDKNRNVYFGSSYILDNFPKKENECR